ASHRRLYVLAGAWVIAWALPLSDILEYRARGDMPVVHRRLPHRVRQHAALASSEKAEDDRHIGRAERGRAGLADAAPSLCCEQGEPRDVACLALVGAHAERRVALHMPVCLEPP